MLFEIHTSENLFLKYDPEETDDGQDFTSNINPHSLEILDNALAEENLANPEVGSNLQFLRQGYFTVDPDSSPGKPVFNRTATLRDTWARIERSQVK